MPLTSVTTTAAAGACRSAHLPAGSYHAGWFPENKPCCKIDINTLKIRASHVNAGPFGAGSCLCANTAPCINNADTVSPLHGFVAGEKTGSKLFLLVQLRCAATS